MKGYNLKKCGKMLLLKNLKNSYLYPSTKMAITPVLFEQIEKFQCLKVSTTQGLSAGTLRLHTWPHVTCLKTCLKVSQLWHEITPKTGLIWFDGQWGLLVYPLGLQKTYVTSLVKFSTLLELRGEVCTGIIPFYSLCQFIPINLILQFIYCEQTVCSL